MSLEELVEHLSIADGEFTSDDSRVIYAQDGIHILHTLGPDVGKFLNLGGGILDLFQV